MKQVNVCTFLRKFLADVQRCGFCNILKGTKTAHSGRPFEFLSIHPTEIVLGNAWDKTRLKAPSENPASPGTLTNFDDLLNPKDMSADIYSTQTCVVLLGVSLPVRMRLICLRLMPRLGDESLPNTSSRGQLRTGGGLLGNADKKFAAQWHIQDGSCVRTAAP